MRDRLRAFSFRRHRLDHSAPDPLTALASVVAVYSAHPTAPLSLAVRCKGFDESGYLALERDRLAVRVPGMRRSIHLVPTASAGQVFAATRQPESAHRRGVRETGLSEAEYDALAARVLERATAPVTVTALQKEIGRPMAAVVREMAYEGQLLRVGSAALRGDSLRYVATFSWLGAPLSGDPDRALAGLAAGYLRAYGPARLADFAWWAGVPVRRAKPAVEAMTDVGDGLLLPPELLDEWERGAEIPDTVELLPKWDAYTMGYAPDGRGRLVDDGYLGGVYGAGDAGGSASGDGAALVLRAGRAVGVWSHTFDGDRMRVRWRPLAPRAVPVRQAERAFATVAQLLGASVLDVTRD